MFVMSRRLLREYMREILTEQDVKFSGILKIMPSPSMVAQAEEIVKTLPLETTVPWMAQLEVPDPNMQCRMDDMGIMLCRTIPLSPDRFHVTLAHQSVLKPFRKLLKPLGKAGWPDIPPPPPIVLDQEWEERDDPLLRRRSWVAWVQNQDDVREYLNMIMSAVGGPMNVWETETPQRVFHVSLANLTGNPGDSVR
jgi:hypothetical protein